MPITSERTIPAQLNAQFFVAGAVAVSLLAGPAFGGHLDESEKIATLEAVAEFQRQHEGRPEGVPQSYDWFSRPVMKQGNDPRENKALTGWGHAFWAKYSGPTAPELQLRKLRVYVCSGNPAKWRLAQSGRIYGREFDADFKMNVSKPATNIKEHEEVLKVIFARGSAFHFWPAGSRYALPGEPLCGVVVTVEARQLPQNAGDDTADLLLGMGADYWRGRNTTWDGKDSNPGIALGRLKRVTGAWRWHALNTASESDTMRLLNDGYADMAR